MPTFKPSRIRGKLVGVGLSGHAVGSATLVKRNFTSGDGIPELVWKIKLWNKPQALELLGRHQGLFREDPPSDAPTVPAFALPPETPGVRSH